MVASRKIPNTELSHARELDTLKEAIGFIRQDFNCELEVVDASQSQAPKAKQAMPGKPAILVE